MDKQRPADVPDLVAYYDHYELLAVEAAKSESDTKHKNDSSKLVIICKQMLLNLCDKVPAVQQKVPITGITTSRIELAIHELLNPCGMICVNSKVDEMWFPTYMSEWRKRMFVLCESHLSFS